MTIELFAIVGFLLASYSIVANDVIQTLGTFMSSNRKTPWWALWIYACSILVAIMLVGAFLQGGDIAYGLLDRIPYPPPAPDDGRPAWLAAIDPPGGVEWFHVVPPLALLVLTRFGAPVSTTFLVLTIFTLTGGAEGAGVLPDMLLKSLVGYVVAFGLGLVVYLAVSRLFERWVFRTREAPPSRIWIALQWLSTAFLWSQWLIQDLANIFVFLPRTTVTGPDGEIVTAFDPMMIVFGTVVMLLLHAFIFATRGGEIQKIVTTKTNTVDVRSATIIDFIYGLILLVFKEASDVPMSTTWVFLGLLAGRELAIAAMLREARGIGAAAFDVTSDMMRALIGLFVSIFLAIAIPQLAGADTALGLGWPAAAAMAAAAFVCFGILWALRRQAEAANRTPAG